MTPRTRELIMGCRLVVAAGLSVVAAACAAPSRPSPTVRAGAEARERAACARGEYPVALDGAAYARARYEDLRGDKAGGFPSATLRLLQDRAEFDRRCQVWMPRSE